MIPSIEQAYEQQRTYKAREAIREQLADTTLVALVGATAVGKNFLMNASTLPVVGTETTRKPRDSDNPSLYTYSDPQTMLKAIGQGELVQYGVSLPNNIYASRLSNYKLDVPNISDIYHDAVIPLKNKGFKTVRAVSVFTPKVQWFSQLALRTDGMPAGDVDARLAEARHSIRWSLTQHMSRAADHLLVINSASNVDENITRIQEFADGEFVLPISDEEVKWTADRMREAIDAMYGRLES